MSRNVAVILHVLISGARLLRQLCDPICHAAWMGGRQSGVDPRGAVEPAGLLAAQVRFECGREMPAIREQERPRRDDLDNHQRDI